jgi:hypothetical protein
MLSCCRSCETHLAGARLPSLDAFPREVTVPFAPLVEAEKEYAPRKASTFGRSWILVVRSFLQGMVLPIIVRGMFCHQHFLGACQRLIFSS